MHAKCCCCLSWMMKSCCYCCSFALLRVVLMLKLAELKRRRQLRQSWVAKLMWQQQEAATVQNSSTYRTQRNMLDVLTENTKESKGHTKESEVRFRIIGSPSSWNLNLSSASQRASFIWFSTSSESKNPFPSRSFLLSPIGVQSKKSAYDMSSSFKSRTVRLWRAWLRLSSLSLYFGGKTNNSLSRRNQSAHEGWEPSLAASHKSGSAFGFELAENGRFRCGPT